MVKDAELNAADDKKKLEIVQARNAGEATLHSVRKSLAEHGDKLEADEKQKIESAIAELETALKGEDKSAIEEKSTAVMTASQKLGEKMYADMQSDEAAAGAAAGMGTGAQQGAGAGGTGSSRGGQTADDDVVDAEVREVKK